MKIKIILISNHKIVLPIGYNRHIQALIYNQFDREISTWLHDNGFATDDKKFKLFVFSPVLEKAEYNKENKMIDILNQ